LTHKASLIVGEHRLNKST